MQKKALVLAVGAALVMPGAFAQKKASREPDSVVELYGKVYPEIVHPEQQRAPPRAAPRPCTICGPRRRRERRHQAHRDGVVQLALRRPRPREARAAA